MYTFYICTGGVTAVFQNTGLSIPPHQSLAMVSEIFRKWALNTENLPEWELRALKSHLVRGFPTIIGGCDSTALVADGGFPHQKTTKSGSEHSIKVLGRDGIEWSRRLGFL